MKLIKTIVMAVLIGLAPVIVGCGGGGTKVETRTTTKGQELIDLEKAYKSGIITEKEYEKQKKEILKRK